MSNKLYEEQDVQNIASSIRAKTGKNNLMTISQMSSEIDSIQTGGGGYTEILLWENSDISSDYNSSDSVLNMSTLDESIKFLRFKVKRDISTEVYYDGVLLDVESIKSIKKNAVVGVIVMAGLAYKRKVYLKYSSTNPTTDYYLYFGNGMGTDNANIYNSYIIPVSITGLTA